MSSQPHLYPSSSSAETSHHPPSSTYIPSTMACTAPPAPPQPPNDPTTTTITSRPKLTLQTSSLQRTFGNSTTALSFPFATGSGASPTVRNTFKNAYDVTSPTFATSSPSKTSCSRFSNSKPTSPYLNSNNHNPFSYRSHYQLPLGVRSILRNSPLDPSRRRSGSISATSVTGAGGAGARRVLFPAKKQVTYRHPLEEEIRTERYTAQHVDLVRAEVEEQVDATEERVDDSARFEEEETEEKEEKEDDSDHSSLSSSNSGDDETSADDETCGKILSKAERKKRRSMAVERQVRAVALLDGLEADSYASSTPQTPRQRRVKRRREWKWTLEPITPTRDVAGLPSDNASESAGSDSLS